MKVLAFVLVAAAVGCAAPAMARADAEHEVQATVDAVAAAIGSGPVSASGGAADPWSVGACGFGNGTGERGQYGLAVAVDPGAVARAQREAARIWQAAGYEVHAETPHLLVAEGRGLHFGLEVLDRPPRAVVTGGTPCYQGL